MKTALNFFARPRYLRAIPSLVLLTTAMAWGMVPDSIDGEGDAVQKKARITMSHNATATPGAPQLPGAPSSTFKG